MTRFIKYGVIVSLGLLVVLSGSVQMPLKLKATPASAETISKVIEYFSPRLELLASNNTTAQSLLKTLQAARAHLDAGDLRAATEAFQGFIDGFYKSLAEGSLDRTDFMVADVRAAIKSARAEFNGRTWRVGRTGDYQTIQSAVQAASPGDILVIEPGRYEENVAVDKAGLTLEGRRAGSDTAEQVLLKGSLTIAADGVVVRGLTIIGDGVTIENASYITLQDSTSTQSTKNGLTVRGRYAYLLLENNEITRNGFDGVHLQGEGHFVAILDSNISFNGRSNARGVGVRTDRVRDMTVSNTVLAGNPFAGQHPQEPPREQYASMSQLTTGSLFTLGGTGQISVTNDLGRPAVLTVDNRGVGTIIISIGGQIVKVLRPGEAADINVPAGATVVIQMQGGVGNTVVFLRAR